MKALSRNCFLLKHLQWFADRKDHRRYLFFMWMWEWIGNSKKEIWRHQTKWQFCHSRICSQCITQNLNFLLFNRRPVTSFFFVVRKLFVPAKVKKYAASYQVKDFAGGCWFSMIQKSIPLRILQSRFSLDSCSECCVKRKKKLKLNWNLVNLTFSLNARAIHLTPSKLTSHLSDCFVNSFQNFVREKKKARFYQCKCLIMWNLISSFHTINGLLVFQFLGQLLIKKNLCCYTKKSKKNERKKEQIVRLSRPMLSFRALNSHSISSFLSLWFPAAKKNDFWSNF